MISAGSETRFPAERPNTAQAIKRAAAFVVCVIANSAAAWLNSDTAVTRRRSRRNGYAERETSDDRHGGQEGDRQSRLGSSKHRFEKGDLVHEETDLGHQRQGERSGHTPECEAPQRLRSRPRRWRRGRTRSRSRSAARKENACRLGAHRRPIDADRDGWDENRCHDGRCTDHGGFEAGRGNRDDEGRRDEDAPGARPVERQADRKPALAVEPQAENVGDRTDVHRRRSRRHDEIDEVELPGCGNESQQSDRTAKTARAGQKDSPRAEPENGIADEYDQGGGKQVIGGGGARDQRYRPTEAMLQLR